MSIFFSYNPYFSKSDQSNLCFFLLVQALDNILIATFVLFLKRDGLRWVENEENKKM